MIETLHYLRDNIAPIPIMSVWLMNMYWSKNTKLSYVGRSVLSLKQFLQTQSTLCILVLNRAQTYQYA